MSNLNWIYADYVKGLSALLEHGPIINNATVYTTAYNVLYYILYILDDYSGEKPDLETLLSDISAMHPELSEYCDRARKLHVPMSGLEDDDVSVANIVGLLRILSMHMFYRIDGNTEEDLSIGLFGEEYSIQDWFKSGLYHMNLITSDFVVPSLLYDSWSKEAQSLYNKDWLIYSLTRAIYFMQVAVQKYPNRHSAIFPMTEVVEWLTYATLWEEPMLYTGTEKMTWLRLRETYPDLPIDPEEVEQAILKAIDMLWDIVTEVTDGLNTDEKFLDALPFNLTGECLSVINGAYINEVSFWLEESDREFFRDRIYSVKEIYGVGLDYIDKPDGEYMLTFICGGINDNVKEACKLLCKDCEERGITVDYKLAFNSSDLHVDRVYWLHGCR